MTRVIDTMPSMLLFLQVYFFAGSRLAFGATANSANSANTDHPLEAPEAHRGLDHQRWGQSHDGHGQQEHQPHQQQHQPQHQQQHQPHQPQHQPQHQQHRIAQQESLTIRDYYCGTDWPDAASQCHHPCPGGNDSSCQNALGEEFKCFYFTGCFDKLANGGGGGGGGGSGGSGVDFGGLFDGNSYGGSGGQQATEGSEDNYCGKSWLHAMKTCGTPCPLGKTWECNVLGGEKCFAATNCDRDLVELTSEMVITLAGPDQTMDPVEENIFSETIFSVLADSAGINEGIALGEVSLVGQAVSFFEERRLQHRILPSSSSALDVSVVITGDYRPPPFLDLDNIAEDSINRSGERVVTELRDRGARAGREFFERVDRIEATRRSNVTPRPTKTPTTNAPMAGPPLVVVTPLPTPRPVAVNVPAPVSTPKPTPVQIEKVVTSSPTTSPTGKPTTSPSDSPSLLPSMSAVPSLTPSDVPSSVPSRSHLQSIEYGNTTEFVLGGRTTSSNGIIFNLRTTETMWADDLDDPTLASGGEEIPTPAIVITGLEFFTASTDDLNYEVWTRLGSFQPHKGVKLGWNLIAKGTVKGRGNGKYTAIPGNTFTPVAIPGGGGEEGTRAFYLTLETRHLGYKKGNYGTPSDQLLLASSPELQLFEGEGVLDYPFPDPTNINNYRVPRQFLGMIHYDRLPCRPSADYLTDLDSTRSLEGFSSSFASAGSFGVICPDMPSAAPSVPQPTGNPTLPQPTGNPTPEPTFAPNTVASIPAVITSPDEDESPGSSSSISSGSTGAPAISMPSSSQALPPDQPSTPSMPAPEESEFVELPDQPETPYIYTMAPTSTPTTSPHSPTSSPTQSVAPTLSLVPTKVPTLPPTEFPTLSPVTPIKAYLRLEIRNVPERLMTDREIEKFLEVTLDFLRGRNEVSDAMVLEGMEMWHQKLISMDGDGDDNNVSSRPKVSRGAVRSNERFLRSNVKRNPLIPSTVEQVPSIEITLVLRISFAFLPHTLLSNMASISLQENQSQLLQLYNEQSAFYTYFKDMDYLHSVVLEEVTLPPSASPTSYDEYLKNQNKLNSLEEEGEVPTKNLFIVYVGLGIGALWCCLTAITLSYLAATRGRLIKEKEMKDLLKQEKKEAVNPMDDDILEDGLQDGDAPDASGAVAVTTAKSIIPFGSDDDKKAKNLDDSCSCLTTSDDESEEDAPPKKESGTNGVEHRKSTDKSRGKTSLSKSESDLWHKATGNNTDEEPQDWPILLRLCKTEESANDDEKGDSGGGKEKTQQPRRSSQEQKRRAQSFTTPRSKRAHDSSDKHLRHSTKVRKSDDHETKGDKRHNEVKGDDENHSELRSMIVSSRERKDMILHKIDLLPSLPEKPNEDDKRDNQKRKRHKSFTTNPKNNESRRNDKGGLLRKSMPAQKSHRKEKEQRKHVYSPSKRHPESNKLASKKDSTATNNATNSANRRPKGNRRRSLSWTDARSNSTRAVQSNEKSSKNKTELHKSFNAMPPPSKVDRSKTKPKDVREFTREDKDRRTPRGDKAQTHGYRRSFSAESKDVARSKKNAMISSKESIVTQESQDDISLVLGSKHSNGKKFGWGVTARGVAAGVGRPVTFGNARAA